MSTMPETFDRPDSYESLSQREQLKGTATLMLVILLAIALKALW